VVAEPVRTVRWNVGTVERYLAANPDVGIAGLRQTLPGAVVARQVIVGGRSGDVFLRLRLFAQEA